MRGCSVCQLSSCLTANDVKRWRASYRQFRDIPTPSTLSGVSPNVEHGGPGAWRVARPRHAVADPRPGFTSAHCPNPLHCPNCSNSKSGHSPSLAFGPNLTDAQRTPAARRGSEAEINLFFPDAPAYTSFFSALPEESPPCLFVLKGLFLPASIVRHSAPLLSRPLTSRWLPLDCQTRRPDVSTGYTTLHERSIFFL